VGDELGSGGDCYDEERVERFKMQTTVENGTDVGGDCKVAKRFTQSLAFLRRGCRD